MWLYRIFSQLGEYCPVGELSCILADMLIRLVYRSGIESENLHILDMGIVAQICNPNTGVEAGGLQIQSKLFSVFKKKSKITTKSLHILNLVGIDYSEKKI